MTEKYLGKIQSVQFGLGGYNDSQFGLHLEFRFDKCCGINTSHAFWDFESIEWSEHCKWSEEDREKQCVEVIKLVSKLLNQADIRYVNQLQGKPVEIELENNTIKSWRLLTEVL